MTVTATPTTLSGSAATNDFVLEDGLIYSGGITLVGGTGIETLHVPVGSYHVLTTGYENSAGCSIDLSGIDPAGSNIQTVVGRSADWSGLVVGGMLDTLSSYRLTLQNSGQIENLVGNIGSDNFAGNALGNMLYGGGAWDTLYGMGGNDTIYGGVGRNDPNDMRDEIYGGGGADFLYGNAGNDYIQGGKCGVDVPDGVLNSPYTLGDSEADGADFIYGGLGSDFILGNDGNDTIYGGGASSDPTENGDTLYGNAGADYIFGNGGADTIYGGSGNDYLHGGVGDDVYVIEAAGGSDTIAYFEGAGAAGGDVLRLAANLNGNGITTIAGLLSHMVVGEGGVWFDLGGGNGLTIAGITTLGTDDAIFL